MEMAIIAFPLLAVLLTLSYTSRYTGIELLQSNISLYQLIFKNEITKPLHIIYENYILWLSLYSFAYLLFYLPPCRYFFHSLKLNPNYPPISLVGVEFLRSFRGIFICSCFEILINHLVSQGYLQWNLPGIFENSQPLEELTPLTLFFAGLLIYLWGDFHFYWTHRFLHLPYFYKTVHKYHHESYNPDPFSGLSMHWFESSVYFSSALLLGLSGCPLFLVRLMFKSLIIFPLEGHNGYGSWSIESSNNHYIHHSKFNWNYGSSPLWDHIMKTNYPFSTKSGPSLKTKNQTTFLTVDEKKRYEESLQQAKEVGCEIHEDYCAPSTAATSHLKGK